MRIVVCHRYEDVSTGGMGTERSARQQTPKAECALVTFWIRREIRPGFISRKLYRRFREASLSISPMIRLIHALTQNLCVRCHECSPVQVERLASRQIPIRKEDVEGMTIVQSHLRTR
jgi:hypothetical protein